MYIGVTRVVTTGGWYFRRENRGIARAATNRRHNRARRVLRRRSSRRCSSIRTRYHLLGAVATRSRRCGRGFGEGFVISRARILDCDRLSRDFDCAWYSLIAHVSRARGR